MAFRPPRTCGDYRYEVTIQVPVSGRSRHAITMWQDLFTTYASIELKTPDVGTNINPSEVTDVYIIRFRTTDEIQNKIDFRICHESAYYRVESAYFGLYETIVQARLSYEGS